MTKPATPAPAIPKTAHAQRGFTLDGVSMQEVKAMVALDGTLHIHQGSDHILIPAHAVIKFKNAVSTLGEIP